MSRIIQNYQHETSTTQFLLYRYGYNFRDSGLFKVIRKDINEISSLKRKLNRILNGDIIDIDSFDDYSKINSKIKIYEKKILFKLKQFKRAKRNYIKFYENDNTKDLSKITYDDISKSSAGIKGWADAKFNL